MQTFKLSCSINLGILFIIFLSSSYSNFLCAQSKIEINIHARINIYNPEVNEIIKLFENYLNHRPDSIQAGNPYWCNEDKTRYTDFDFTRKFLYDQLPLSYLSKLYSFTILSIEKEQNVYAIRTALLAKDLSTDEYLKQQNPWAITRIYAIKENKEWKLKNAFDFRVKNWKTLKDRNIVYHYPPDISLNNTELKRSRRFCDSVAKFLQIKSWLSFNYYIAPTPDEMCQLIGFDFAVTAFTTGMSFRDDILLNGIGTAFYPHEFVHHIVVEKRIKHYLIIEGIATWLGGTGLNNKKLEGGLKNLANAISEKDSLTFDDVLEQRWGWMENAFYLSGGLFCKLVYEKHGLTGLEKLYAIPENDNIRLKEVLRDMLNVKDLNTYWRMEILKYKV